MWLLFVLTIKICLDVLAGICSYCHDFSRCFGGSLFLLSGYFWNTVVGLCSYPPDISRIFCLLFLLSICLVFFLLLLLLFCLFVFFFFVFFFFFFLFFFVFVSFFFPQDISKMFWLVFVLTLKIFLESCGCSLFLLSGYLTRCICWSLFLLSRCF